MSQSKPDSKLPPVIQRNGKGSRQEPQAQALAFPLSLGLKVIMEIGAGAPAARERLAAMLTELELETGAWSERLSDGGNYVSFTVEVTFVTREAMFTAYQRIGALPGVRTVL